MPSKKKRAFTKKNSVKFLLLHGHENAQNADGETLKNVLVPVSKNYKPGSSLLMSRVTEIVNESNPPGADKKEPNLAKIMGQFDDASDSESEEENSNRKIKKALMNLKIKEFESLREEEFSVEEEFEEDDGDDYSDFSDDSDFNDEDETHAHNRDCPENLKILEERMKRKLQEYGDDQLGALDDEEICGYLAEDSERVKSYISPNVEKEEEEIEIGKVENSIKEKILNYCVEDHVEEYAEIVTEKPIEYDCESIISTYSNKYNHPTVIKEEQKVRKIKIPNNPLKKHLTKSELKCLDAESKSSDESDDKFSIASTIISRPKGETPEQRKERKNLFKEAKRESRMLKKENKLAFKNEKKAQKALAMSIQINQGIKFH